MLPSPWAVVRAVGASLSFLAELPGHHRRRVRRRARRQHRGRSARRARFCAIALGAEDALPVHLLLQTVPIIAIAPLILMWVGAGIPAVTLIAFIISVSPIIANTTQGLISVDENLVHLFLMQNASRMQLLFKLRLPNAVPSLFVGIRIASGLAVIGAITGELFAGSSRVGEGGLGYSILYASSQLQTDYLFALGARRDGAGIQFPVSGNVSGVVFSASLARIGPRAGSGSIVAHTLVCAASSAVLSNVEVK